MSCTDFVLTSVAGINSGRFFRNLQLMIGTFPEKYGRIGTEHPDFGTGIIKMGADTPIPLQARSAAAPDGMLPRQAREHISGNVAPPQIPFNGMRHHRTRGDVRAAGGASPKEARSFPGKF